MRGADLSVPSGATDRFAGKTAVITGGAQGIGLSIARMLAHQGAAVVLLDRDAGALVDAETTIRSCGASVMCFAVDVASRAAVGGALDEVVVSLGVPDVVVNNAGVGQAIPFLDLSDDEWDRSLRVNLTGSFIVAQLAARLMASARGGAIVNVASLAAELGSASQGAYSAAKAGILGLTRVMAVELAQHNIRVNAILPGPVVTDLSLSMQSEAAREERKQRIPLGRFGYRDEIANAVAFLCSEEASFINGASLVVDGGFQIAGIRES